MRIHELKGTASLIPTIRTAYMQDTGRESLEKKPLTAVSLKGWMKGATPSDKALPALIALNKETNMENLPADAVFSLVALYRYFDPGLVESMLDREGMWDFDVADRIFKKFKDVLTEDPELIDEISARAASSPVSEPLLEPVSSPVTLGKQVEAFIGTLRQEGIPTGLLKRKSLPIELKDVGEALLKNIKPEITGEKADTFRNQLTNKNVNTALLSISTSDLWKIVDRWKFIASLTQLFSEYGVSYVEIEEAVVRSGLGTVAGTISSSPVGQAKDEKVGGINLDPALLDLQIRRDANFVPLPLPQQPIQQMHIEGFIPVIINITPVTNLPMLLGLADTEQDADETGPAMKAREPEEISVLN